MKTIFKVEIFLIVFLCLSCTYNVPEIEPVSFTSGTADFSRFITIGSSFTAGYMDGALYSSGQKNSYSKTLANQLSLLDESSFIQPDINSRYGYNEDESEDNHIRGKYIYQFSSDTGGLSINISEGELPTQYNGETLSLNNFGIPNLKSFQFRNSEITNNAYLDRITSGQSSLTLIDLTIQTGFTFFSFNPGINDVLNFAKCGATGNASPDLLLSRIAKNDLTPLDIFSNELPENIDTLLNISDTKGVVMNIPNVTEFPFFSKMPTHCLQITDDEYDSLAYYFRDFNQAVELHNNNSPDEEKRPFIHFIGGYLVSPPQPLLIEDKGLPDAYYPDGSPLPKIRLISPGERVLFNMPTEQVAFFGFGSIEPVPDKYILTIVEINKIEERIISYNNIIQQIVNSNSDRLALVDLFTVYHELYLSKELEETGANENPYKIYANGIPIDFGYEINGGIFSLDGIYPNPRGNAFIAKKIIEVINDRFNSSIPKVSINNFRGNTIEPE